MTWCGGIGRLGESARAMIGRRRTYDVEELEPGDGKGKRREPVVVLGEVPPRVVPLDGGVVEGRRRIRPLERLGVHFVHTRQGDLAGLGGRAARYPPVPLADDLVEQEAAVGCRPEDLRQRPPLEHPRREAPRGHRQQGDPDGNERRLDPLDQHAPHVAVQGGFPVVGIVVRLVVHLAGEARVGPVDVDEHGDPPREEEAAEQVACHGVDVPEVALGWPRPVVEKVGDHTGTYDRQPVGWKQHGRQRVHVGEIVRQALGLCRDERLLPRREEVVGAQGERGQHDLATGRSE